MTSHRHPNRECLADAFDALASAANNVRKLVPQMSLHDLAAVSDAAPWTDCGASTLLDLDLWAVATAATLRNVAGMVG